jgi:cytosine/adenosine deaminase-related metal-dependent hydrolase
MPLMTHLAETEEEYAMFQKGEGPLYDFLKGIGRDMSDTGRSTPFQHLVENSALPKGAILTHMNVLSEEDWALLAQRKEDFSVVHCPNCHIYFQRAPFDLERFLSIGVNICLGTDSLASNKALNMFEEMRTVRELHSSVPLEKIIEMVSVNSAKAIGLAGKLGEISPGALADLIAVPFSGGVKDVACGVIDNRTPVEWLTVQGERVPLGEVR